MLWLLVATFAYFLVSLEVILDKFLLSSKKVSHPAVYAFYSGLLSSFALILIPFGAKLIPAMLAVKYIALGVLFLYGILCFFFAIGRSEASRVIPVVGAIIPIGTYVLSAIFLGDRLAGAQVAGVFVLIFGGLLISFELPLRIEKNKFFAGFKYSVMAGFLLAAVFTALKHFYTEEGAFINVFMWSRFGVTAGALSLLLFPAWRRAILRSSGNFRKPRKENTRTGLLFVSNKAMGGVGSILVNYAISLGNVTVVNAMVSLEYVFVFLIGLVFSVRFPDVFQEKRSFINIFQKAASILIITVGIILAAGR